MSLEELQKKLIELKQAWGEAGMFSIGVMCIVKWDGECEIALYETIDGEDKKQLVCANFNLRETDAAGIIAKINREIMKAKGSL